MGASGIVGALVDGSAKGTWSEKANFLAGLVALPAIIAHLAGGSETHLTGNLVVVAVAG